MFENHGKGRERKGNSEAKKEGKKRGDRKEEIKGGSERRHKIFYFRLCFLT